MVWLVLLIPLIFATGANALVINSLKDTSMLFIVSVMILLFIVVIAYMVSKFLNLKSLLVWSKQELIEVFYSVILFVLLLFFIPSFNFALEKMTYAYDPISAGYICSSNFSQYQDLPCHIRVAKNFMAELFYECAYYTNTIISINLIMTPIATTSISVGFPAETKKFRSDFSVTPFGVLRPFLKFISFLIPELSKIMLLVKFQEIFITFFAQALFPTFLVLGLILRTFNLSRKLGGLLIALALCLYFLYPLPYILGDITFLAMKGTSKHLSLFSMDSWIGEKDIQKFNLSSDDPLENVYKEKEKIEENLKNRNAFWDGLELINQVFMKRVLKKFLSGTTSKITFGSILGLFAATGAAPLLVVPSAGLIMFSLIDALLTYLAKIAFLSVFFSFLAIFGTIGGVKILSPMFGGSKSISGLTRLI